MRGNPVTNIQQMSNIHKSETIILLTANRKLDLRIETTRTVRTISAAQWSPFNQ